MTVVEPRTPLTTAPAAVPHRPLLPRLGGAALLAAPVLMLGATLISPPQDSGASGDYIASLARDHGLTALSAGLFHYAWIAIAFGALAAVTLVPGRRGRGLTAGAAVATAFGAIQFSGLLFSDWYLGRMGDRVPAADAVAVFDAVTGDPWIATWLASAKVFGLLGLPLLAAGLARAGVVGRWTVPALALPMVGTGIAGAVLGSLAGSLIGLALWSPLALIGLRLLRRPAVPAA